MPRVNRREIVPENQIGVFHCIQRCVRRAFLCGFDHATQKNFDHRKLWVQNRLRQLELPQTILDPELAMVEVLLGGVVEAAEEGASDAALDAVEHADLILGDDLPTVDARHGWRNPHGRRNREKPNDWAILPSRIQPSNGLHQFVW